MRARTVPLHAFMPYGAPDMQQASKTYLVGSLLTGSGLWSGLFGLLFLAGPFNAPVAIAPIIEACLCAPPTPLPPIQSADPKSTPVRSPDSQEPPSPSDAPEAGVPIPVPEPAAPDLSGDGNKSGLGNERGPAADAGNTEAGGGQHLTFDPPNSEPYVFVDELPEPVHIVQPSYPELAKSAGIGGTVYLKALVGKDGRVLDVIVVKSIPLLDEAAVTALRQWVFKPGFANRRPVSLWIGLPVRFSLHEAP